MKAKESNFKRESLTRFANEVRSGQYVVYVNGIQLTPEEVITADTSMMDIYNTRKRISDADGNFQKDLVG